MVCSATTTRGRFSSPGSTGTSFIPNNRIAAEWVFGSRQYLEIGDTFAAQLSTLSDRNRLNLSDLKYEFKPQRIYLHRVSVYVPPSELVGPPPPHPLSR